MYRVAWLFSAPAGVESPNDGSRRTRPLAPMHTLGYPNCLHRELARKSESRLFGEISFAVTSSKSKTAVGVRGCNGEEATPEHPPRLPWKLAIGYIISASRVKQILRALYSDLLFIPNGVNWRILENQSRCILPRNEGDYELSSLAPSTPGRLL